MTTKQKIIEMLMDNGMFLSQAEKVMEAAIPQLDPSITWDRPANEYPDMIFTVLFLSVKPIALVWIEENAPQAWFKPMFQDIDFAALKEDSEDLQALTGAEMENNIKGAGNVLKKAIKTGTVGAIIKTDNGGETITMESFKRALEQKISKTGKTIIRNILLSVERVPEGTIATRIRRPLSDILYGQPWEPLRKEMEAKSKSKKRRLKLAARHK